MADGLQCVEENDGQGIREKRAAHVLVQLLQVAIKSAYFHQTLASHLHGQLKALSGQWVVTQSFYVLGTPSTL